MNTALIIGVIILLVVIWALFSKGGKVKRLHALYEVGASAEKRYEVAGEIFSLAMNEHSEKVRLNHLHKALDVILCEGKLLTIEVGSSFHQDYWTLGHKIAIEIKKLQPQLNIHTYWFEDNYSKALELIKKET